MALTDLLKPRTSGLRGLAGLAKRTSTKPDLETVEGLKAFAESKGLEVKEKKPKLSFLQRLATGLSSFNPAEAILTGTEEKSALKGLSKYATGIVKGLGSAVTGKDLQGKRRFFSDVAEKIGVENKIAKFGLGFLGDVLLDPSTYFGGALIKGLSKGVKVSGKVGLGAIGKFAPETEQGLRLAGTGLKDALGRAFSFGYKSSKGASDDVLTFLSKQQRIKMGLAESNLNRLGSGVLTKSQQEELALRLIAGKRAEFLARESGKLVGKVDDTRNFIHVTSPTNVDSIKKLGLKGGRGINKEGVFGAPSFKQALGDFDGGLQGVTGKDLVQLRIDPSKLAKYQIDELTPDELIVKGAAEKSLIPAKDLQFKIGKEWKSLDDFDLEKFVKVGAEEVEELSAGQIGREAALKGATPEVRKVIEAQIARSKKFGEQIGLETPYESYFPFIKKDKLQKFLNETRGLKVGSEGYRKQFKNILTNESIELDPASAFFTRESQVALDSATRGFLHGFVKRYGKNLDDFSNADEALKAGYHLVKEKGVFGKDLGYLTKYDSALLRDSLTPEFQTINMIAKATGFDALTSLFKRSVTGLFAPFHVRNFVSGNIQNFEVLGPAVFNPKNIAIGQKIAFLMGKGEKIPKGIINIGGKTMQFDDVMKPFVNRFSGDTFYNTDFLLALKHGDELKQFQGIFSKAALKETAKTVGLGQESIPFKVARAVGQYIEHQQKATAYITALGQGKNIDDALKLAEKAGFDYRALTRFESQIMRRIIPFYSFTRKNIELQLKTLGENPQRINQVLRFFGGLGVTPTDEEKANLPNFIKESIGIKLQDTPEGLQQYISSFGTPIEAFTQLFGTNPLLRAISTMNPLLKVPIELGFGKDSFRQRDLKDVYNANEYKLAPQIIKDLLDIKEVQKPIFKTVNGKAKKIGERTAYIADPIRLLIARSLFTSRGVTYLDQVFGNDMRGFVKFLKTTTGIKPQQVDIEAQNYFNERDERRALEDLLTRYGVTKQFTKTYVPKD